jgi:hypothetical protein
MKCCAVAYLGPAAAGRTAFALPRLRPARHTRSVPGVRYNPDAVKRVFRILLNALTALSLVLFAATVALWFRNDPRAASL